MLSDRVIRMYEKFFKKLNLDSFLVFIGRLDLNNFLHLVTKTAEPIIELYEKTDLLHHLYTNVDHASSRIVTKLFVQKEIWNAEKCNVFLLGV